ncbi:hypothetical protein GCM10007276_33450 [Agaricicola taiwanensis]|uniref:PepSY domain-containing protein n=1 Tax=Agaricicola taiwanensis TaxID=591372 RepID=A0A8J2YN14_9RHOB|nr:PepSY domain-containing protein [Agaricicola taiwanensis]GGE53704.1 hypothetical protein GCM10007276_33450 [Agaricicola taiwanensis]
MLPRRLALLSLVFFGFCLGAAQADDDADRARAGIEAGRLMPLARILDRVRARYPGEVLEVELDSDDDAPEYEIRLLRPNGRIVELGVDGRTGRILDVDEEDED